MSFLARSDVQYVRIYDIADGSKINIAEVQAFDSGGQLLTALEATLSTTSGPYYASLCIDGDVSNFCHSSGGADDWLRISYGPTEIASIVVTNRAGYFSRIVGATIGLSTDIMGGGEFGFSTFRMESASYTFDIGIIQAAVPLITDTAGHVLMPCLLVRNEI
jgi:hypothetical protein